MRLLSVRLIVSLIVGITLVSLAFSYYEVLREKRVLGVSWNGVRKSSARALRSM